MFTLTSVQSFDYNLFKIKVLNWNSSSLFVEESMKSVWVLIQFCLFFVKGIVKFFLNIFLQTKAEHQYRNSYENVDNDIVELMSNKFDIRVQIRCASENRRSIWLPNWFYAKPWEILLKVFIHERKNRISFCLESL
jgi:hypothetical protein